MDATAQLPRPSRLPSSGVQIVKRQDIGRAPGSFVNRFTRFGKVCRKGIPLRPRSASAAISFAANGDPASAERDSIVERLRRDGALWRSFACFAEIAMRTRFKVLAVAAVLATAVSSAAMARYPCAPGYTYRHGVCQPIRHLGYGNPVSGAVSGEAAGAARGNASGGPVGAVVGGALGTASGALNGTANMLTPH